MKKPKFGIVIAIGKSPMGEAYKKAVGAKPPTPEDRDPETWYYGITKEEFERAQVFIMTPGEFACIDAETRKNCFVVYLDIDREIREDRILGRNDKNDSVQRRLDADEEDFKGFGDYDLRVTDPDFTAEDVYDLMD
jgi:hypothetical protein